MTSENFRPAGKPDGIARPVVLCLLLVVVTLAVYWPVIRCDFVNYDDPDYFSSNRHVLAGLSWSNLVWAFTTGFSANWHPLTWLSLMLDAELFGKGPVGPHLTNLLFHLANTVLLFLLLRQSSGTTWRSAFAAALFALHPMHVESVSWVSERKDVLSTFFGLLALLAYVRYVTSGRWQVAQADPASPPATRHPSLDYFIALVFFAFSLMSKPMLVTLPFVMLLLDYWPLKRFTIYDTDSCRVPAIHRSLRFTIFRLVWEKIPFFLLSAISCVVTFVVQQKAGAVAALARFSASARMGNAFVSYARYLAKTFWPVSLANPYPYVEHWPWLCILSAVALFVGLCVAAVWLGRKFPFGFTGWFWFVGTLVPVIGLVQVGGQSMSDRYGYVPLIGLFIIMAWTGGELWSRRCLPGPFLVMVGVLVLVASAWLARIQTGHWQNTEKLFRHALAVTENNYTACVNLGTCLSARGDVPEAVFCYYQALQMNPTDPSVLYDLGNGFAKLGMWDEAIANYRRALEITPNQADILDNLGFALGAKKQYAEAIVDFEAALKLKPDSAEVHNNLATVLFIQKRFDEAVRHFREALRVTPDDPRIYVNLGDALVKQGQTAEAVRSYQDALRLKPGDPRVKAKLQALGVQISN
jgi:Flp pilus assembly protein TadD